MNLKMMFTQAISKDSLAAVIMWVLAMNQRPMGIDELCMWTASGDDKVRNSVKTLEALEAVYVECREHGMKVVSIAAACQDFLPGFAPALTVAASLPMFPDSGKTESGVIDAVFSPIDPQPDSGKSEAETGSTQNSDKKAGKNGDFLQKPVSGSGKSEAETGSIMIDDDELINSKKHEINHQSEPASEKIIFPKLAVILEKLDMLFGESLGMDAIPADTSPKLALAWISKLWVDFKRPGSTLNNPHGVLVRRLKAKEPRKLHLEVLPDEYLVSIGLRHEQPKKPTVEEMQAAIRDEQARAELAEAERQAKLDEIGSKFAGRWNQALEILREQLPTAGWSTWCDGTLALGEQGDALVVGCRNDFAVKWMQQKAAPILDIKVNFVVLDDYLEER
jgi:hypothetical protein